MTSVRLAERAVADAVRGLSVVAQRAESVGIRRVGEDVVEIREAEILQHDVGHHLHGCGDILEVRLQATPGESLRGIVALVRSGIDDEGGQLKNLGRRFWRRRLG